MTHARPIEPKPAVLCLVCALALPLRLCAAPADDARAHFDAGRYGAAYESLIVELESVNPDPASVALALEALLAQGRILKAGEVAALRVQSIHGEGAEAIRANAEAFYYAGRVAELTGDDNRAASRYGVYIQHSQGKSELRRKALLYLLNRAPSFERYRSYVSLAGRTPDTRLIGTRVAELMLNRGFKEFAGLARYHLQLFPTAHDARRIVPRFKQRLDARELSEDERVILNKLMREVSTRASDDRRDWRDIGAGLSRWVAADIRFEILCRMQESGHRLPLQSLEPQARAAASLEPDRIPAAAKRLVAYEPIYAAAGSHEVYAVFLDAALAVPDAFRLTPQQLAGFMGRYRDLGAASSDVDARLARALRNQGNDAAGRGVLIRAFRTSAGALPLSVALTGLDEAGRDAVAKALAGGREGAALADLHVALLQVTAKAGEKDRAAVYARQVAQSTGGLLRHARSLEENWLGSGLLPVADRIAVLRDAYAARGVSLGLNALLCSVASGTPGDGKSGAALSELREAPDFKSLLKSYQDAVIAKPAPGPVNAHWGFLSKYGEQRAAARVAPPEISSDARKFLVGYRGAVPSTAAQATNLALVAAREICLHHRNQVAHDPAALGEWGRTWVLRLQPGPLYQRAAEAAVEAGMDLAESYAAALDRGAAPNALVFYYLAGIDQLEMGLKPFVPIPTAALRDKTVHRKLIPNRPQWRMKGGPEFFTDLMWEYVRSGAAHPGEYDYVKTMAKCHWQYVRAGSKAKQDKVIKAMVEDAKRDPVSTQINVLNLLIDNSRDATDVVTLQTLPGLYDQLNRFTRPRASVFTYVRDNLAYWQKDPESTQEKRKAAARLDDAVVSQMILGLGSQVEVRIKQERVVPAREWLLRHIVKKDWVPVSERVVPYSNLAVFEGLPGDPATANTAIQGRFKQHVVPVLDALEANGGEELGYVLLSALGKRGKRYAWLNTMVNDRMARVASGLDIIPVHEHDPMYPLHKAARAVKNGNTGQAWLLTRDHLDRLVANWRDLNRDYVVWTIEQLRKRQFYEKGLEFASELLLSAELDPADRAAISLVRGDLFRDLGNYDAARIEYQSLRDNKDYEGMEPAMLARYRLIEMMIDARAYDNAEPLLERLMDHPDSDARAEAWYLKARIAFAQESYDACKEHLDKAFSLAPGHAEGLLLDGELRLHRERGLDEIEIRLGEKQLRTVLVPGRPLRLTLADRSLVVARHGKQVPVLVTTKPGGDRERLILFPAAGNRTSFSGVLSTSMGEAVRDSGRIELLGDDSIHYEIAPDFRAQFELEYGPKSLHVKSDGKLVASAGVIMSEEELEQLRMEQRLGTAMNRAGPLQPSYGTTVRPGNPVYVQVTDKDRNTTLNADTVQVNLETSSGDKLRVELKETDPLSTVFKGEVTTGIPFARASVSDSLEGNDPNAVISSVRDGRWESEEDGVAPKWIQVDTMTSHEFGEASVTMAEPARVSRVSVGASLRGAPVTIAEFPDPKPSDQVWLQAAPLSGAVDVGGVRAAVGPVPPMFGQDLFERKEGSVLKKMPAPSVQPGDGVFKGNDGGVAIRLTGYFYQSETAERSMRCTGLSTSAWARLLIDGEIAFERREGAGVGMAGLLPVMLTEGAHHLELLIASPTPLADAVSVGWQDDAFKPLDASQFSLEKSPRLSQVLTPNATIDRTDTGFALSFREPKRYRKLEWVFEEFEGLQLQVSALAIQDPTNGVVVPVARDFTMGLRNEVLEIASGDRITLSYHDEKRLTEENPVLTTTLDAAYANGNIALTMEVVRKSLSEDGEDELRYYSVERCRRGDTLQVVVTDTDEDQSAEADTLEVLARTAGGESLVLKAIEDTPGAGAESEEGIHTGRFRAILRLGDVTEGHTIKLNPGELLFVSYLDRENLDPGVPVRRVAEVVEAGSSTPALFIIPQNATMAVDSSPEAAASLARLLRKSYNRGRTNLQIWAMQTTEWLGDLADEPEELWLPGLIMRDQYLTSLDARLQIRVVHPAAALHEASQFRHVKITTRSELDDAVADGREPRERKLSLRLMDMENGVFGTSLGFEVGREAEEEPEAPAAEDAEGGAEMMMDPGAAGESAEMEMTREEDEEDEVVPDGSPEMESSRYRVLVSADDIVRLRIENAEGGVLVEKQVVVASDAFAELLDRSFTARDPFVHLGEVFNVRVRDRDQDQSPERDMVRVAARTASGKEVKIELNETFARSGVFEGKLVTAPVSDAAPAAKPAAGEEARPDLAQLMVLPGEDVAFEYQDARNVSAAQPRTVTIYGSVRHGANGGVAAFSKRFQDAEMAVKTSFLMAEALFEMAKDQRKLKNTENADALIAQGREVLEDALRDFPDTSLVVRGEYLLANLAEELGNFDDAIRRYSDVSSSWPDSGYAPRALFKKALCLEKRGEPEQALEEYVRLTYLYKNHDLASDAVVRLASYYYKRKRYETSAEIFTKFQQNNPEHRLAAKALTLAGLSHTKGEAHSRAMEVFQAVVRVYPDEKTVRSEAMYWLGDSAIEAGSYADAYRAFKQLTWDYPESKWAKMARGRLTENVLLNAGDRD